MNKKQQKARLDRLEAFAREAIAGTFGVKVARGFEISFEDLSQTPEWVRIEPDLKALGYHQIWRNKFASKEDYVASVKAQRETIKAAASDAIDRAIEAMSKKGFALSKRFDESGYAYLQVS